jgi:glucose-6-phosphate dehydrogenase assembly protein OpcA
VVVGEAGSPSRELVAGWLRAALEVDVRLEDSAAAGTEEVRIDLQEGQVRISRDTAGTALLCRTGQPDRRMPLEQRALGDLLAEELRRLDADETYARALSTATGVRGLEGRPATRTHVWHDPTESSDPDPALTTA